MAKTKHEFDSEGFGQQDKTTFSIEHDLGYHDGTPSVP
jgi:hypothetical protein